MTEMIKGLPQVPPRKVNEHALGIDLLRFVAASMVASLHLWGSQSHGGDGFVGYLVASVLPGSRRSGVHMLPPIAFIGSVGVQIFFTISGFVIAFSAHRSTGMHAFLYNRTMRLAPGLWICTIVTGGIAVVLGYYSIPSGLLRALRSFVLSPVGPKVDDVIWTLDLEIVFYCYVAALIRLKRTDRLPALAFLLTACCLTYWSIYFTFGCSPAAVADSRVVCGLIESGYFHKMTTIGLVQHGAFFGLGIFFWAISAHGPSKSLATGIALSTFACVLQLIWTARYYAWTDGGGGAAQGPELVLAAWAAAMLFMAASIFYKEKVNQFFSVWSDQGGALRTIGLATYPLYLCHGFVGGLIVAVMVCSGASDFLAFGTALGGSALVAIWIASQPEPALRRGIDRLVLRLNPGSRRDLTHGSAKIPLD
jgi:peptidoglycan/LPS O-acetylase OafA/YrhL